MNIYITRDNSEFLINQIKPEESMSGLINRLLDDYRNGKGPDLFPPKSEPLIRPMSEVLEERTYAKPKTIEGIRVEPLVKPPKPTPPPELEHKPMPKHPHRYYHTEWEEYVKWTPEEGITQP